jgi:hypothetical protein
VSHLRPYSVCYPSGDESWEAGETMSKLDRSKEEIAYLKLWLGILVAVCVSLAAWLLAHFESGGRVLVASDIVALLMLGFGGYAIHKRIEARIAQLEEL